MTVARPDYGIDAPYVLRNSLIGVAICSILYFWGPDSVKIGPVIFLLPPAFKGIGIGLALEVLIFLFYVRVGKFRHADRMLAAHTWQGDESVLDIGCGRGLLLAAAANLTRSGQGRAVGLDIWSNNDMGGNSEAATRRNLALEGVSERCELISAPAQSMPFEDRSFDIVVSNMCLHNIEDTDERRQAVRQIARVLKPGGKAILSDYIKTGEYAAWLKAEGLAVERRWGSVFDTIWPLRIVVAQKP